MIDHIKTYWTAAHAKYAEHGHVAKPTIFVEEIFHYLPHQGQLLELGAGQGQDSRYFAQRGLSVTSTDLAPEPLRVSQELAAAAGLSVTFAELDIAKPLPFGGESFDVVYSHMALHYFDRETTEQMFAEIHRVLKPSGIFAALFNTVDDPETRRADYAMLEPHFYRNPEGIEKRYFSVDSLRELTSEYFDPILLDNEGRTYKDDITTLIRFVSRKKELVTENQPYL